jgi:catechol 2,3-dioxygenase-like lactoylglutathione lyase family enzyme
MITGLDHVHVICQNVEEAVQYFKRLFDGKEVSRGEVRGLPMVRIEVQGVPVNLMGTEPSAGQLIPGKGSRGLDHFGFKVRDMDRTIADLQRKGARVTLGPSVTSAGIKYAFIEGPESIRIELVERG